jgi:hypothetical protein
VRSISMRGRRTGRIAVLRDGIGRGARTCVARGGFSPSGCGGRDERCGGGVFTEAGNAPARRCRADGACLGVAAAAGPGTEADGTDGAPVGRVGVKFIRVRAATGEGRETRAGGRGRGAGVGRRRRASQAPPAAAATARRTPPPRGAKRGRRRNAEARPTGRTEGIGSGAFREARSRSTSLRRLTFGRSAGASATRADGGSRCRGRRRARARVRPPPPPPRRRRGALCARRR